MRSIKLLVAALAVAALVSGPVLAQDAMTSTTDSSTTTKTTTKHHKKHTGAKKHHSKKAAAPATDATPAQ